MEEARELSFKLKHAKSVKEQLDKAVQRSKCLCLCAQMFQILKEEKRVPSTTKKNSFKFTSTQHVLRGIVLLAQAQYNARVCLAPLVMTDDIDKKSMLRRKISE